MTHIAAIAVCVARAHSCTHEVSQSAMTFTATTLHKLQGAAPCGDICCGEGLGCRALRAALGKVRANTAPGQDAEECFDYLWSACCKR